MKLKIVIVDFEVPPRVKRWALRVGVPAAVLVAAGAVAYASLPHTFASGEVLTADNLNASLQALDQRLAAVEAFRAQATHNGGYSVGATYCGSTITTNGQITGGHAGAKTLCQSLTACGSSPSAHMCTSDELDRSMTLGVAPPSVANWYASGAEIQTSTSSGHECLDWTSAGQGGELGPVWSPGIGADYDACSASHPVACCN